MRTGDQRFEPTDGEFLGLNEAEIQDIETTIGCTLPEDYSTFVGEFGGCGFSGDAIVRRPVGDPLPIFSFFGGGSGSHALTRVLRVYEDLALDQKIPIADDLEGNIFVLDPASGDMFYIDFTSNPPEASKVADTFSEFLAMIEVGI